LEFLDQPRGVDRRGSSAIANRSRCLFLPPAYPAHPPAPPGDCPAGPQLARRPTRCPLVGSGPLSAASRAGTRLFAPRCSAQALVGTAGAPRAPPPSPFG